MHLDNLAAKVCKGLKGPRVLRVAQDQQVTVVLRERLVQQVLLELLV